MNLEQRIARYVARERKVATNCYYSFTNIFDCADSHYSKGTVCYKCTPSNKNAHQFRLNNKSLKKFASQVENALNDWSGIYSFEDLFAKVKNIAKQIKKDSEGRCKLGELVVYDCSARIAYLKYVKGEGDYRPKDKVYIHADVYKGAQWLFEQGYIENKPKCNTTMSIEDFGDEFFKPLFDALDLQEFTHFTKSMILESFMCMMIGEPRFCNKCRIMTEL